MRRDESMQVQFAKQSMRHYLETRKILTISDENLPAEMSGQAGVFVSLKKNGQLRGCIGTFMATQPTVAQEIIRNAVSAATEDPRFPPVSIAELSALDVSVDVLGQPEKVSSTSELDPVQYGVIVKSGRKTGLLLPDLEGVDTVEYQVSIARQKAGIRPDETVELYRFNVTRYK